MTQSPRDLLAALARRDRALSTYIAHPAPSGRTRIAVLLGAHLGDSWLWLLIGNLLWFRGAALAEPRRQSRRRQLIRAYLAVLTTVTATMLVKRSVERKRPGEGPLLYGAGADRHSFPSGHASRMATIALLSSRLGPGSGLGAWLLALLIGWCRVRLGIHYVGDVAAGYALGGAIGWLFRK